MKYTDPRDHKALSAERRQEEATRRNTIEGRIDDIVARDKERQAAMLETPHWKLYNTRRRVKVTKVG